MVIVNDNGVKQYLRGTADGDDYFIVSNKYTTVLEFPTGKGFDTIESNTKSYTVTSIGIEKIILGTGGLNILASRSVVEIVGNDANNLILGGQGKTLVDGGAGNDIINGGLYSDTLLGGAGNDVFQFGDAKDFKSSTPRITTDTLLDFNPLEDSIDLSTASFKSLANGITFSVVDSIIGIDTVASKLIYCTENGGLYYNPNQAKAGFDLVIRRGGNSFIDSGGMFALLTNKPELTIGDITLDATATKLF